MIFAKQKRNETKRRYGRMTQLTFLLLEALSWITGGAR